MNMSPGIPWLDQPVLLHSSRVDNCTLTESQCQYRNYSWRYWYAPRLISNNPILTEAGIKLTTSMRSIQSILCVP